MQSSVRRPGRLGGQVWRQEPTKAKIRSFIADQWAKEATLISFFHGAGSYGVVMDTGIVRGQQRYKECAAGDELTRHIEESWASGFSITGIMHDGKRWWLVTTEGCTALAT